MGREGRMGRIIALGVVALAAAIGYSRFTVAEAAASCESLASLKLPNTSIASAQLVAAGTFSPPAPRRGGEGAASPYKDLPAFCRVTGSVARANDTDVKLEV